MKKVKRNRWAFFILGGLFSLFFAAATSTWAKPVQNRQRMMEKIETIKMWKLMDALNLDSQTALKVFPVIKEMDRKRADLMRQKRDLIRQIHAQNHGKSGAHEKIDVLASKLFDLTEQLCTLSRKEYEKLKPLLTEKQLGQYLLFQQRFKRELLHRWIQEKRKSPPRRLGAESGSWPRGASPQN